MADPELKVKITADQSELKPSMDSASASVNKAVADMQSNLKSATDSMKNSLSGVNTGMKDMETQGAKLPGVFAGLSRSLMGFVGISVSIAGVVSALKTCVSEAAEAEDVSNRLRFALEGQGYAWDDVKESTDEFAASIQKTTRFSDEDARRALTNMLVYTRDLEKAQNGATLAMDMSVRIGQDMASTTRYVGMALNGNVEVLGRWLPEFRNVEAVLGKSATQAEKAAYAMKILNEKFGGTAQADVSTYSGIVKQFDNAWRELAETIGIILLPKLKDTFEWLKKVIEKMNDMASGNLVSKGLNADLAAIQRQIAFYEDFLKKSETAKPGTAYRLSPEARAEAEEKLRLLKAQAQQIQENIAWIDEQEAAEKPKSLKDATPAADLDRSRQVQVFRLQNESKILEMQGFQEEAIKRRHAAELLAEDDASKKADIRKRQAVELEEFYKGQNDKITEARIESERIATEAIQAIQDEAAKREAERKAALFKMEKEGRDQSINAIYEEQEARDAAEGEAVMRGARAELEANEKRVQNGIESNNRATEAAAAYYQKRQELGEISAKELAGMEQRLEEDRFQIEMKGLNSLLDRYQLLPEKYQEVLDQIEQAQDKHANRMDAINHKLALDTRRTWGTLFQPIRSALDSTVSGIIMGTQTLQQGLNSLWQNILASYVNMLIQMGLRWVEQQLFELVFGQAIQTTAATAKVVSNAAVAATAAMASVAAIPYVGWAMAPGVGAETFAMAMGYLPMAAAEGGWDVDRGAMTMLHAQEMVLPADLARGIREKVIGDETGSMRPSVNKIEIKSFDSRDVARVFRKNSGNMLGALRHGLRNFQNLRK